MGGGNIGTNVNQYFKGPNHWSVSCLHANTIRRALTRVTNRPIVNTITIFVVPVHFLLTILLWPGVACDQSSQLEETISCGDHREGLIVLGTTRGNLRIFQLIPQGAPPFLARSLIFFALIIFVTRYRFILLSQEILAVWWSLYC